MAKVLQAVDGTHSLYQYSDGFSFGTDAVLLAGMIRPRREEIGVEFGTGTGIIPLLLSIHKEFKKIYALEIQKDYAELAAENIALNGFSDRVEVLCADLKEAPKLLSRPCDFVFSNPPYMRENTGERNENEKKRIARHELYCTVEDVCASASAVLKDRGSFYCIYRTNRLPQLFSSMQKYSLEPKNMVLVTPTPSSPPDLVLVRGIKSGMPELKTRPPFILQEETGERTREARLLYEDGILDFERKRK